MRPARTAPVRPHLRDHAREPLEVERHRRPQRAVHHPAGPHLHDGRPLLRRHPPVDAELHRRIAGDNFGIQDDKDQNVVNLDRPNLVDQLEAHAHPLGRLHGGPPRGQAGPVRADAPRQPGLAVREEAQPVRALRRREEQPGPDGARSGTTAELGADLERADAPQFVWISPNQCNDMHGGVYTRSPATPRPRAPTAAPRTTPTTPPSSRRPTRSCKRRSRRSRARRRGPSGRRS